MRLRRQDHWEDWRDLGIGIVGGLVGGFAGGLTAIAGAFVLVWWFFT